VPFEVAQRANGRRREERRRATGTRRFEIIAIWAVWPSCEVAGMGDDGTFTGYCRILA